MPEISTEMAAIRQREHDERQVPGGYELVAVPNLEWRPVSGKGCRRQVAGRKACRQPAVAELARRYRFSGHRPDDRMWWAYCPEHMYGNWIEDGMVMHWILREKQADG
jgi:hypothetical protein